MAITASGGRGVAESVSDNYCQWGRGVAEFVSDDYC